MTTYLRTFIAGAGTAALLILVLWHSSLPDRPILLAMVALVTAGCAAGYWQLLLLAKGRKPRQAAAAPAAKPAMLETVEEPAASTVTTPEPVRTQTPRPPQFVDQFHHSIFDAEGIYQAPNQPLPGRMGPFAPDPAEDRAPLSTARPRPSFDPLARNVEELPPLGRSWEDNHVNASSPWDDEPLPPLEPILTTGPLLPRRPATDDECRLIQAIYEETGSMNKTIARVYGQKDGRTHAWVKEALE